MTVRLTGGAVPGAPDRTWVRTRAGRPADADTADLPAGTPVVVGPRSADDGAVEQALDRLAALVRASGPVIADAGIDLDAGFRSARTDGGAGDRRDAVLMALAVPGLADRLGDRRAVAVALFGPGCTKPLGAAAQRAADRGRWATLRLAVAAGDLLGPEQLVRLLDLDSPDGVDPFPDGLPSVVGGHLARVLRPLPAARRAALVTDLWQQACTQGVTRRRRERFMAAQPRRDRVEELHARRAQHEETLLREYLEPRIGPDPSWTRVALWQPTAESWLARAARMLQDVLCATVLARVAATALDHGIDQALHRHRVEIEAGTDLIGEAGAVRSARAVPGLTGLPARPGSYLRDLRRVAGRATGPLSARQRSYLQQRLARARSYADVADRLSDDLIEVVTGQEPGVIRDALWDWVAGDLRFWRDRVGYLSPRRLDDWAQPPLPASAGAPTHPSTPPLTERLRAAPDRPPEQVETIGDLFWYGELADALAGLNGQPTAEIEFMAGETPWADIDPAHPVRLEFPDNPLVPRLDSIAFAAAGTAQLVDLGGEVPRRCRSWPELVTGLLDAAAVAEAITGSFVVPPAADEADGTTLPGSSIRIEVARTGRQLADWAAYMGNCLAGGHYADRAIEGRATLVALRAADGRILANLHLRPTGRGWRIEEIRARYNLDPDPTLLQRARTWVAGLAGTPATDPLDEVPTTAELAAEAVPAPGAPRRGRRAGSRPSPAARTVAEVGDRLDDRCAEMIAEPGSAGAAALLAALAGRPAPDPRGALFALRRTPAAGLVRLVRRTLADPAGPGLAPLWSATGDRPLTRAVRSLPAADGDRLALLLLDAPLPGSLRRLARLPQVATARTADLVALRLRAALGALLRQDATELAGAVRTDPTPGLLRAAVLTVTSWGGLPTGGVTMITQPGQDRLPGFPPASPDDADWRAARPEALELGARPDGIPTTLDQGLLLPDSWLDGGGWPALWSRAHRRTEPSRPGPG